MKRQGTGIKGQGSDPLLDLLREAMPPVGENVEIPRDLWPAMQRRLEAEARRSADPASGRARRRAMFAAVPWFDWALAGGLLAFVLASPVSIPVLLYYL